MSMKSSVSSYSFSQYLRDGRLQLEELPERAVKMGFAAMDFTTLPEADREERLRLARRIRAAADAAGLPIACYAVGAMLYQPSEDATEAEIDRLRGELEIAAILGAGVFRHDICHTLDPHAHSFGRMMPRMVETARRVADYAAGLGIRDTVENHGRIAQDSLRVEAFYNAVDHDNFGILLDVGNFACADEDSVTATSRLAPYAFHVHAKDFYCRSFEEGAAPGCFVTRGCAYLRGAAIGAGVIPVRRCLSILAAAGYNGYVAVEYEGVEDCLPGIEDGLAYLRENCGVI